MLYFSFQSFHCYVQAWDKKYASVDEEDKNWKHNEGDWEQGPYWDKYMEAYEDVLNRSAIPWTVTPVDERWYRDYIVAKTLVERLEELKMTYPTLEKEEIDLFKKNYV